MRSALTVLPQAHRGLPIGYDYAIGKLRQGGAVRQWIRKLQPLFLQKR